MIPPFLITPQTNKLNLRAYLLVFCLCLCFFLPGFFTLPPIDRDEPHFAQATKQMLETENFTDIRFQEAPRYKKPIGIYWLQAAAVNAFSPDKLDAIWPYRVPSLIGALIAVLFTVAIGDLFFGPAAGILAGILMLASVIMNVEARLAKTDAAMLACVTAAQFALAKTYKASMDPTDKSKGNGNALLFWTAQSLAFLLKGPILLLISLATILTTGYFHKRNAEIPGMRKILSRLHPAWGLPLFIVLAAPWFIAINMASHGSFMQASAGHDLLAKIWQGQNRRHIAPGLHMLAFPFVFFPSSLLVLLALPDIWHNRRDPRFVFCLGWLAMPWIIFELSLTKLPHYVMPLYPALAVLASYALTQGYPSLQSNRFRQIIRSFSYGFWGIAALSLVLGFALLAGPMDGKSITAVAPKTIIMLTLFAAFAYGLKNKAPLTLPLFIMASMGLYVTVLGNWLPNLNNFWITEHVMQVSRETRTPECPSNRIATTGYNEPSLVFDAGTRTLLLNNPQIIAEVLMSDPCFLAVVNSKQEKRFLDTFHDAEEQPPTLISTIDGFNLGSGRMITLKLYKAGGVN